MYPKHHAPLAAVTSAVVAVGLGRPGDLGWLVLAGTAVGVLVDLDHFPISRYRCGDWRAIRRVVADPTLLVSGEQAIFAEARVGERNRLVSHLLLIGPLVAVGWWVRPALGAVVAASLGTHVVADLLWDRRRRG
jgi:hypothetical protein